MVTLVIGLYYAPQIRWSLVYTCSTLHRPGGSVPPEGLLLLKREGSYCWLSSSEKELSVNSRVLCTLQLFACSDIWTGKNWRPGCWVLLLSPSFKLRGTVSVFYSSRLLDYVFCWQSSFFTWLAGSFLSHRSDRKLSFYLIDHKLSSFFTWSTGSFLL